MILTQAIFRVVSICRTHRKALAFIRAAACAILASALSSPLHAANTIVRMDTTKGIIDIELYDDQAPLTVTNFLRYAGRGYYDGVIIHRSVPGFIIQGGGYKCCNTFNQFFPIPTDPPVQNEFDPSRPNIRSTIAMAKVGGNPDSATSQWFFNLADNNSTNLDNQNGGFTVFGHVLDTEPGTGMDAVDAIAGLQRLAFDPPFDQLPVLDSYDTASGIQAEDLVIVNRIPNVKSTPTLAGTLATFAIDVDMTFDAVGPVNSTTAVSWLQSFTSPPNQSVYFNNGILALTITGVMGPSGRTVTLYDGATTRPTRFYAYSPTQDNPSPHWYEFMFDGETGAEIKNNRIILHFVDGKRGDGDLTANSITHAGARPW